MAFVIVPNVVQANLRYTLHGQQIQNTLYFRNANETPQADMLQLAQDLWDWVDTSIMPSLSNEIVLNEVYCVDLSYIDASSETFVAIPQPAGRSPAQALPASVALCISFRTTRRGRSYRGRNYIAGVTEPDSSGSAFNPQIVEQLRSAYTLLLSSPFTPTWEWVVVSRFINGIQRDIGVATPVTAVVTTDLTVDSQRRRLPGRGR